MRKQQAWEKEDESMKQRKVYKHYKSSINQLRKKNKQTFNNTMQVCQIRDKPKNHQNGFINFKAKH